MGEEACATESSSRAGCGGSGEPPAQPEARVAPGHHAGGLLPPGDRIARPAMEVAPIPGGGTTRSRCSRVSSDPHRGPPCLRWRTLLVTDCRRGALGSFGSSTRVGDLCSSGPSDLLEGFTTYSACGASSASGCPAQNVIVRRVFTPRCGHCRVAAIAASDQRTA